ncbi:14605_t:CDS:1, partial [Funneliformis mosseae]
MVKLSTIIFIFAVIATAHGVAVVKRDPPRSITVESKFVFCIFLPKKPGEIIGNSEQDAIPFCTKSSPNATGAKIFPSGFIKTAFFKKEADFVQVTGTIDRTKYKLKKSDGGGQYDIRAPLHANCTGFKNFVNIIEPDENIFCIRCCNDITKCNTSISTKGCKSVVHGHY